MTSISTIESIEVDVDLEKEIPCDNKCERAAEWLLVRDCCGFQEFKCTPHKEKAVENIRALNLMRVMVICEKCRSRTDTHHYIYVGRL